MYYDDSCQFSYHDSMMYTCVTVQASNILQPVRQIS